MATRWSSRAWPSCSERASVVTRILEALAGACPTFGARPGAPEDAFDGVEPGHVARPASTGEVAATMAASSALGLRVAVRGGGTKLDWGLPPSGVEVLLDLTGMGGLLEHAAGDLVLRAEAGARLTGIQSALLPHRQWLPIDEVLPGSTLGGVVATGLSGPTRHREGGVRDLLIGATAVRADGTVARVGGRVVKNVAGYDLCKLFTGSYGTLAVLTEVTFRLRPLAAARRFLRLELDPGELAPALRALRRAPEAPSALELVARGTGPVVLRILLEGRPDAVGERASALGERLGATDEGGAPPAGWGRLPGEATVKVTSELAGLGGLVATLGSLAAEEGLAEAELSGLPGVGVVYLGLAASSDPARVAALLSRLRRRLGAGGGATVLRGPAALRGAVDCWGEVPGLELMRRIKDQLDPDHLLAPGRFVGGI